MGSTHWTQQVNKVWGGMKLGEKDLEGIRGRRKEVKQHCMHV